jgi:hypothetical protein
MKMIKLLVLGSIFSLLFSSCLLLAIILYPYPPSRQFHKVGNMEFTFWVHAPEGVYVMPYKYTGSTIPKNDYMIVAARSTLLIYIGEDTTLYIFPDLGAEIREINLTSYKPEYFPYINELDAIRARSVIARSFYDQGYPFINFDLHDWYVIGRK